MNTLHLSLRTPFEQILTEDVQMVVADTDAGQVTLLPDHATVTGTITAGKVEVRHQSHVKTYFVRQGVFDLDRNSNKLNVLAFSADALGDIELQSIREHLKMIEAELETNPAELSQLRYKYLQNEKLGVEKAIASKDKK